MQFSWLVFALLGALFAAIVNVLSKKALDAMDFLLAVTIQAVLMLATLGVMTTVQRRWSQLSQAPRWAMVMMGCSGIAAGFAWFFGYQALHLADIHRAAPIDKLSLPIAVILALMFLRERPSLLNWAGIVLMLAGALCVAHQAASKG